MLYWIIGGALYIIGGIIYAMRVPEKCCPRKFDLCGSSHQIFHVIIVIAAFTHIYASYLMYLDRFDKVCPIS